MLTMRKLVFIVLLLSCPAAVFSQDNPAPPPPPTATERPPAKPKPRVLPHKFWDKENIYLFAGVGATRVLDYASTRHLRNQGNNEWLLSNPIVDNRPLFVGIELAGTAASIGVSYLFHYYGHHTLERWVSIIHIGVGVGGSIHNYLLKPVPLTPQPVGTGITIQPGQ